MESKQRTKKNPKWQWDINNDIVTYVQFQMFLGWISNKKSHDQKKKYTERFGDLFVRLLSYKT